MKNPLILLALLLPLIVTSQNFSIEWQNCLGGPERDTGYDLIKTDDGYLVVGMNFLWETKENLTLFKIDNNGNLVWNKTFGGSKSDGPARILNSQDGNYFIVGGSSSIDGDISYNPYLYLNFWVLKIDSNGNKIWDKMYGGNGLDHIWNANSTSDGGLIAIGWTDSKDGDVSNYYGMYDAWMIRLDKDGEKLWDISIGNNFFNYPTSALETSDKGFLFTSSALNYSGGNIGCSLHPNYSDIVLTKLDSTGSILWQQCYGGTYHESAYDMIEVEDGYILIGNSYSEDGDATGSGYHIGFLLGNPTSDIWVIKTDVNGNIIWQRCYGGYASDHGMKIFATEDGGFIGFAQVESNDGDVSGNHSNGTYNNNWSDVWMFKINSTGDLLWQRCFGNAGPNDLINGVCRVSENHFVVVAGKRGENFGDVECNDYWENEQIWVFSVRDTTVGISEIEHLNRLLNVYPSPANDYIIFESEFIKTGILTISDIYGNTVKKEQITGKHIFDTSSLAAGVYIYSLTSGNQVSNGKFVVSR